MHKRSDTALNDQWNLAKMYKNNKLFEADIKLVSGQFKNVSKYQGKLKKKKIILECLLKVEEICRKIEFVYTYASLRHSEDLSNSYYNKAYKTVYGMYAQFSAAVSFIDPELLKLSEKKIKELIKDKEFKDFKMQLKSLLLQKNHVLSDKEEKLLAHGAEVFAGPYNIFSTLDNVDLKFGEIKFGFRKRAQLTHGNYQKFLEDKNERLRKTSYTMIYTKYGEFLNTYAEVLNLKVKQAVYLAQTRNYDSALHAALGPKNIDVKVYHALIKAAHKALPQLSKYFAHRAKGLRKQQLNMWDLRVPLVNAKMHIPYDKGVDMCVKALHPLGEEYLNTLENGLKNGWVDKYENLGKRSGAFSSGMHDTNPYILMNYTDTLNDVFTLIHEGGHSMHSYMAKKAQSYSLSSYTIFTAEIASTFNERLLADYLIKTLKDKKEVKYVMEYEIDALRATFFRQTMFAEFELLIHQEVENGGQLTADRLSEIYKGLNIKYYGKNVVTDDLIAYEWARIPHFYYNFYVYQYATGVTAAYTFSDRILKSGEPELKKYFGMLKAGGNDFPLNQLKKAGINMNDPKVYDVISKRLRGLLKLV